MDVTGQGGIVSGGSMAGGFTIEIQGTGTAILHPITSLKCPPKRRPQFPQAIHYGTGLLERQRHGDYVGSGSLEWVGGCCKACTP